MTAASQLPPEIADVLARGGIVITSNQRAARTLRLAFDWQCRSRGLTTWQSPEIHPWDTWMSSLWRRFVLDGGTDRILLNRSQELQVWRSVISADKQWSSLQTVDSLAAMAADAWQGLCAYRGQKRLRNIGVSGDTRTFQRWAQAFNRRCNTDRYLAAAELEEALSEAVSVGTLTHVVAEVLFVGFDSKTPAQQGLIEALRDSGCLLEDQPRTAIAERLYLAGAASPDDELISAARWLREFLTDEPRVRIAVIVPDLDSQRHEIDRTFRHILAPELDDITVGIERAPYEFSLGQPLADLPMVRIAVEVLRFAAESLSITTISRLLLSSYFATASAEHAARAEFDAFELRRTHLLRPELSLERLISLVETGHRASRLNALLSQLRGLHRSAARVLHSAGTTQRQKPHADWAENFRELLQASGWPGTRTQDSIDFQTRRKWESALDEFAALDFEGTRPGYADALGNLEAILERTFFAPESHDAPIQIMSPQEAAGSRFDALYFLHCSDLDWPTRPAANPLLGWQLQRDLAMPGSDVASDNAHAQQVTKRLISSAGMVVFSYAVETADAHQQPSPLLGAFEFGELASTSRLDTETAIDLEVVEENNFIPLTNLRVEGGANLLKLQAACGFRAFAEERLRSSPLDTPQPGMDARESGNVVHGALEHFWSEVRTQAALREMSAKEREVQLARSIEHSLADTASLVATDPMASAWDVAYLDLQRQRLHRLLAPWLDLELERPAFEVEQREARELVTIGPLQLKVRVDRVDRTLDEEGGKVVLDYKTGNADPKGWSGERPDEPQLPLYAALREPRTVAAVGFANIRAGDDLGLIGFSARGGLLRKERTGDFESLEEQIENWRRVLTNLAHDFAAGDARVRPKDYPVTCKHCGQRLLCRLDPATLQDDSDENEEDASA